MALTENQGKQYNEIVDKINDLLLSYNKLFAGIKEPEYAHCIQEASRYMEVSFLYINKGCNMLHIANKAPEEVQRLVDDALKDPAKLHIMDAPPSELAPVS